MTEGVENPWTELEGRLLREVSHDLNGRASALRGLTELLRLGRIPDDRFASLLEEEADRVEEISYSLKLLVPSPSRDPESFVLDAAIRGSVALFARLERAEGFSFRFLPPQGDIPPVSASWTRVHEALLLALDALARYAGECRDCSIRIRQGVQEGEVRVSFTLILGDDPTPRGAAPLAGGVRESVERGGLRARWEAARDGGTLDLLVPSAR